VQLVVIIPARVPLDETPFISRYEAWALGLVFLKIWVRCTMLGVFGNDYAYKVRFEKIKTNGLRRLDFTYTMVEVVLPLLWHLSCLLMTPHFIITAVDLVLSRDLAADPPLLPPGLAFDEAENALLMLKRHGYMVYVLLRATLLGLGLAKQGLCHLHDRIRDDQYLVGLELKNRVLDDKDADPSTITT
jgi:E3 ubiquitin-protein ligase MARCH6